MNGCAKIYNFYKTTVIRLFRFIILVFLLWITFQNVSSNFFPSASSRFSIFLLSFFLIFEIFFRFKISRAFPSVLVSENDGKDIYKSFTFKSIYIFLQSNKTSSVIKLLLKEKSAIFILDKADIEQNEIPLIDLSKEELSQYAFEVAKNVSGKYVTTPDLLVSYLLLIEDQKKLLFSKNLKKEELMHILYWVRTRFPDEENPKSYEVNFWGEGIGENWVFGWTIEAKRYMLDLISETYRKKSVLFDRDIEYREIIEALYDQKSVVLVGEPGSGRRELVETLALDSLCGNLKGSLYHLRFFQLMVDALLAGSQNQGELEARLDTLIAELAHAGNVIVFIPFFENILGASSFHLDLSGVLIPYLEKGIIRLVATISPGAYKKFIEPRKDLAGVFEIVKVEEPENDFALQMLFKKTIEIEEKSNVGLTYRAIIASLKYCKKYLPDRVLPGAAVALLEDSANAARLLGKHLVEEQDVIEKVKNKTKIAVGKPNAKEKDLLLHLEEEMHRTIVDQKEAVSVLAEALRRIRTELETKEKPISFLFLGPTGVGKTETAKTLARLYFGGEDKMIRVDMSEYAQDNEAKRLLGSLPGEEGEGGELTDKVYDNPFSLVLLDEFEKGNKKILDLFLQVLDDGRLTDNKGKTVSFVNTIIIATSNAASEFIREEVQKGKKIDKSFQNNLLEFLQRNGIFKPELLNRFDGIVVFKPLAQEDIAQITQLLLSEFSQRMKEKDIEVTFDPKAIEKIIKEGFDEQFGARPLRRYIQDNIEDLIAQKILKEEIKRGDKITVSTDSNNYLQLVINN